MTAYGGLSNYEFSSDLKSIVKWMDDDSLNGGGAWGGGGDGPECALDGLYHETLANWDSANPNTERMINPNTPEK